MREPRREVGSPADPRGPAEKGLTRVGVGPQIVCRSVDEPSRGGSGQRLIDPSMLDRQLAPTLPRGAQPSGGGGANGHGDARDKVLLIDGHYALGRELGRGGMGIVYLATDTNLLRDVALKMISPTLGSNREWRMGFQKEAVALASIRSQHVVQVYAFGQHAESCFFAMEYVRGKSLRQVLDDHRDHDATIPVHRTLTILERLANGLDAVHATGLVHRDVKPANVVIEDDTGRPVLVDFGLAMPAETRMDTFAGTPSYIAPEQSWLSPVGTVITPRADVYALGCVAFEMLTGRLPFERDKQSELVLAHMHEPPPAISSIRPDLAPFDAVLNRALAKRPERRYDTCPQFVDALLQAGKVWQRTEIGDVPSSRPAKLSAPDEVRRILIVDDDPSFRRFATRAVQLAFYGTLPRIASADSGMAALASAADEPPDLILLDLDMPRLDGVDTLSRLRALPYGERAHVLVLSGKATWESRWRFSVLGVSDFIDKPIDLETLVESISAVATPADRRVGPEQSEPMRSYTDEPAAWMGAAAQGA